jgi:EAL domain-containing protein (putative c-di-GMP-specific phosphodiesterase class I)
MAFSDSADHSAADGDTRPVKSAPVEQPTAATVRLAARLLRLQSQVSRYRQEAQAMLETVTARRTDFQGGLPALATVAAALDAEIRDSVWRDAFFYEYQPIVCTLTGAVAGYEALLRWRRKDHTLSPAFFLPIAEETRSIIAIQQQLLSNIAAVYADLSDKTSISINWSPTQLSEARAVSAFIDRVRELRIDPSRIVIEITEHSVKIDPDSAYGSILRLKEQGFAIALDQFGKGYCALSYLRHLPIDYIKIDGSLIKDAGESARTDIIVAAIIDLAHRLGNKVVAEGVETDRQLACLRAAGCDYVQGFLIGHPSKHLVPKPASAHTPSTARRPRR